MISSKLTIAARRLALPSSVGAVRSLNIHEYLSMDNMKKYGIQTPEYFVTDDADEAEEIFLQRFNNGTFTLIEPSFSSYYSFRVFASHSQHSLQELSSPSKRRFSKRKSFPGDAV